MIVKILTYPVAEMLDWNMCFTMGYLLFFCGFLGSIWKMVIQIKEKKLSYSSNIALLLLIIEIFFDNNMIIDCIFIFCLIASIEWLIRYKQKYLAYSSVFHAVSLLLLITGAEIVNSI